MKVLIVLYDGFTEFEYVIPLMALHYVGIPFEVVGLEGREITGMTGLKAFAEKTLGEVDPQDYQALFLPGVDREKREVVLQNPALLELIRKFDQEGKLIAAICMAPVFLGAAGVLKGRRFTSSSPGHPSFEGAHWEDEPAVRDGNLITGKGERVFHFTALLLEALAGEEKAEGYRRWAGIA